MTEETRTEDGQFNFNITTEFSPCYPWFKLVAEVAVPFDLGITVFRFELMPLIFQQAAFVKSGEDALADALIKITAEVGPNALISWVLGTFIIPKIAAQIACSSIMNVALVVGLYAIVQTAIAFILRELLGKTGLVISVVSFFISAVISAFMTTTSTISNWVQAIYRGATGQIKSIWHSWWGRGLGFVNIVAAFAFFFVDIGLGALLSTFL